MRTPDEILDRAKLAECTVPLYLGGDNDLAARYEVLRDQLADAKARPPSSLADMSPAKAIEDEMATIEATMAEDTVVFRLRAMRRRDFANFRDQYPPRKDENGNVLAKDIRIGANTDEIWEPLIRTSVVDPEWTEEQFAALFDHLSDAQFDELGLAAFYLNRSKVDVPFSSAASRQNHTSAPE